MNGAQLEPQEPANLKFLRMLVTVLTGTMIIGVVVIIGLVVMRITAEPAKMGLPDNITLPQGASVSAFTVGDGWYAVVTNAGEILIYDRSGGNLRKTIQID